MAIYVHRNGLEFREPSEEFNEQQAFRTVRLAKFTLEDGQRAVESLRKWGTREKSEATRYWQRALQDLEEKGLL